jgi:molecular chaperone GrpE (heat shock protein)
MTDDDIAVNKAEDRGPPVDDPSIIGQRLAAIEQKLHSLRELFDDKIRYDEAKEQAFDVLYQKMRFLEADHESSLKKSLVFSLLLLHDRMQHAESELRETAARQRIHDLRTQLLDILYAEGVEPIETRSEAFDCSRQEALNTIPTMDPTKDNTVEQLVREGFLSSGKVIRPQTVIVRRYKIPAGEEKAEAKGE